MFDLDAGLPAGVAPLAWLIGVWEGTGVVHYRLDDEPLEVEFAQRLAFTVDGSAHLAYSSTSWRLDEAQTPLANEIGYWRLSRPLGDGDPGPGMLPARGEKRYATADEVETLRSGDGFDIEVSLLHPDGVQELYLGRVAGPRIDLATDAVVRSATAKEYAAATRLYGLVEGHLLWAWDIAALGQPLRTHASGRLAKVD